MTITRINGVSTHYEVHGDGGAWVALSPGGRRGLDEIRSLAKRVAAGGYRVLIQDRRNCGASEASVAGEGAAEALARLMPNAEIHDLMGDDVDLDVDAPENWDAKETALAEILVGCLTRMSR